MGIGPVPSTRKLMARLGLKIGDFDLIELNEAFASQALACLRQLGLADDAEHVNPNGGAIALGHPLGMSGARLALTAVHGLEKRGGKLGARHDVRRRRPGRFAGARARLSVLNPATRKTIRNEEAGSEETTIMTLFYPTESHEAHPPRPFPDYKSTVKRSPSKPLIVVPHTLSELTGPVYGHERVQDGDNDLTKQHKGEPIGERIIVHGRVLDEDGRPVPDTLVEIWQANACGRYVHVVDQHPAPLDPNFTGAGRAVDRQGRLLPLRHHQARRLSVGQPPQCLASGAHPLLAVRAFLPVAPRDADVFSRRSAVSRSIRSSIR